jgi:hypothetical protein
VTQATRQRPISPSTRRYVAGICKLHEDLGFRGLPDAVTGDPLHVHESGDGLLTLAVRDSQLPARYLRGILGFRFSQYLRLGWISPELTYQRALYHEPLRRHDGVEDVHILTLSVTTGKILGYVGLAGSMDPAPLPLDAPVRSRLTTEIAHDINMLAPYAAPGWNTHQVFEVKRFLRNQAMPAVPIAALVPWHIVLGFGRTLLTLGGEARRVLPVGDAKESVAIRHLRLMGLRLDVVHGTSPSLPGTDLYWPIYQQDELAKPFVGRLPETYAGDMDIIEAYLEDARGEASVRPLVATLTRRRQEVGP